MTRERLNAIQSRMNVEEAGEAARFCDYLRGMLFAMNVNDNNADAIADAQRKLRAFHSVFSCIADGTLELKVADGK